MVVATNRINGMYHGVGGAIYKFLTTPARTGNLHFAFEATEPPGGGPPLHIHTRHEEFFFALEGEISFWIDGQVITRSAGGTAFVLRGVAHCLKNCSDKTARVLVLFTPGDIEGFFEYGKPLANGGVPPDELLMERIAALGPLYGLELLGPSPLR